MHSSKDASNNRAGREIDGEACIWIAWNDRQNINLWGKKEKCLLKLEAALQSAHHGDLAPAVKQLEAMEKINARLAELNTEQEWTPVYVFATYELGEHFEKAVEIGTVEVGGLECKLLPADEPESIKWGHLEFNRKQRRNRWFIILAGTTLALAIGATIITVAGQLAGGVKYVDFCADAVGPAAKSQVIPPVHCSSTPQALTAHRLAVRARVPRRDQQQRGVQQGHVPGGGRRDRQGVSAHRQQRHARGA